MFYSVFIIYPLNLYYFEEKAIFMCLANSKLYLRLCPLQSMNYSTYLIVNYN